MLALLHRGAGKRDRLTLPACGAVDGSVLCATGRGVLGRRRYRCGGDCPCILQRCTTASHERCWPYCWHQRAACVERTDCCCHRVRPVRMHTGPSHLPSCARGRARSHGPHCILARGTSGEGVRQRIPSAASLDDTALSVARCPLSPMLTCALFRTMTSQPRTAQASTGK